MNLIDELKKAKFLLAATSDLWFVFFHKDRSFELIANVSPKYADSMKDVHKKMDDAEKQVKKVISEIKQYGVKSVKKKMDWMWKHNEFTSQWLIEIDRSESDESLNEIGKVLNKYKFKGG